LLREFFYTGLQAVYGLIILLEVWCCHVLSPTSILVTFLLVGETQTKDKL